jgi:Leucine-rich repeat (LRR) protein
MAFLSGASYLRNLQKLFLDENNLTHISGKYFGDSQYLTQLKYLSLGFNKLGDLGV